MIYENGFWKSLFTPHGRNSRLRFWGVVGLYWIVAILCGGLGALFGETAMFALVISPVMVALFVVGLFNSVKRLHDLGRSGWWLSLVILVIAPIVLLRDGGGGLGALASIVGGILNLLFLIVLGAAPGQPGSNRFGSPPGRTPATTDSGPGSAPMAPGTSARPAASDGGAGLVPTPLGHEVGGGEI